MHRTVIISVVLYIIIMGVIIYIKPDQLYNHSLQEWTDDDFINITNVAIILSVCVFLYVRQTET